MHFAEIEAEEEIQMAFKACVDSVRDELFGEEEYSEAFENEMEEQYCGLRADYKDEHNLEFGTRPGTSELVYISCHLVPLFDFTKSSMSQTYEFRSPSAQNKEGQVQQRERKPNWSNDEDEALCKAWLRISEDPATLTDDQLRTKFWDRILAEFNTVLGWETERYSSDRGYYNSEGHHFKWDGCWLLLKDSPKWLNYRGKQVSKDQKTAHTNVEGFNVDLHQTIDSSTPATTPSSNAGSGSLDDEDSPFVKESYELPPSGREPAENIRRKKNCNELDAIIKSFVTEFRNLRKEQKEITEQEIAMLNK
ncbi:hypothetical protein RHSIM_Rhsim03G0079000 [Rhododendron simsii]|uniref:No apical meristem-associated C-terminal domain-containing protein n=1 Tax=Rhododendron simsii TaxID=118357 RepID=A0A834H405_RHOSS|nr:hypothetical protein RHSIM_Rhsim03G0079000 [Rhododendron simsii]